MIDVSELREAVQQAFPIGAARPDRDTAWKLATELGWLLVDLPENLGGLGLGQAATTAIHFELGRVVTPAPLIPALLGLHAIAAGEDKPARLQWLGRVCAGEYIPLPLLPARLKITAGLVSGTISGVAEADMASHIVTVLPELCLLVSLDNPAVALIERPVWDQSRRLFDVVLTGYPVSPELILAEGDSADSLAQELESRLFLALAADCLGGASAALDLTVDYLKTRRQFDRPLAMLQALKHRCADLKTAIAAAEALLWSCAGKSGATLVQLGALKAHASDIFATACEEMIQLHGGIGLTSEHECHHLMKRAMLNQQLGGSADRWYERAGRAALEDLT